MRFRLPDNGGTGALPARYAMFRARTVGQAADHAGRFGGIFGDVVVEVRPVNEAWDLGFAPKPEGLTTRRYMAVVNANAASEGVTAPTADQKSALKAYSDELGRTGAFLGMEHFEPSAKGKRLRKPGPIAGRGGVPGSRGRPVPFLGSRVVLQRFQTS